MKIILIDPDETSAAKLHFILNPDLKDAGFPDNTWTPYTSAEAFLSDNTEYSDMIIITEIDLSGMNGLLLAEKIREHDWKVPIVFYTTTNDYAMQCYDLDIAYYLLKPISKEQVDQMTKRLARRLASC